MRKSLIALLFLAQGCIHQPAETPKHTTLPDPIIQDYQYWRERQKAYSTLDLDDRDRVDFLGLGLMYRINPEQHKEIFAELENKYGKLQELPDTQ